MPWRSGLWYSGSFRRLHVRNGVTNSDEHRTVTDTDGLRPSVIVLSSRYAKLRSLAINGRCGCRFRLIANQNELRTSLERISLQVPTRFFKA